MVLEQGAVLPPSKQLPYGSAISTTHSRPGDKNRFKVRSGLNSGIVCFQFLWGAGTTGSGRAVRFITAPSFWFFQLYLHPLKTSMGMVEGSTKLGGQKSGD